MTDRLGSLLSGLTLALIAALGFSASYYVQFHWFTAFDFLPHASVLFLPAGVKLFAMISGRLWGVLGLYLGDVFNEYVINNAPINLEVYVIQPFLWLAVPYVVVIYLMHKQTIAKSLDNLTLYHVVILAIVTSFVNAIVFQLNHAWTQTGDTDLLKATWAMTVGDISGIVVFLAIVIAIKRMLNFGSRESDANAELPG